MALASALRLSPLAALLFCAAPASGDLNFLDFSSTSGLNFVGDTTTTQNALTLTKKFGFQSGAAWYATKQRVDNGFETTFEFRMITGGADGMAFVIQNDTDQILGLCGGSQGYSRGNSACAQGNNVDILNSLVVELDVWNNGEYTDPDDNHVSVHTMLDPAEELADHVNSIGYSNAVPDLNDGVIHTCRVTYDGTTLEVFIDDLVNAAISTPFDISTINLDQGTAWVGFTGATGGANQTHAVRSWSFKETSDFLISDTNSIGLISGGTATFSLSAGQQFAGLPYLLMGSMAGTSPGIPIDATHTLPLNADSYWVNTLISPNNAPLGNSFNFLDLNGQATATFTIPPNAPALLAGFTVSHAFVAIELIPGVLLHAPYVSDAVDILLLP